MAVSVSDLVYQIERDYVIPIVRPEYDTIGTSFNTSITSIVLATNEALIPGSVLNHGFEMMYVTSYNANTKTATVIRGFLGSTAAAGTAGGLIRINPHFPDTAILDAMLDELRSWGEDLFTVQRETVSLTTSDIAVTATPTRNPYRVLAARMRQPTGYSAETPRQYRYLPVELRRNEPTSQFSTGYSLHLTMPVAFAVDVDVFYALPFDLTGVTGTTALDDTVGLSAGMLEILKLGAIWRLMAGRETARVQGVQQRADMAQALPAGVNVQIAETYKRNRDLKYAQEARRLLAQWPMRFYA